MNDNEQNVCHEQIEVITLSELYTSLHLGVRIIVICLTIKRIDLAKFAASIRLCDRSSVLS